MLPRFVHQMSPNSRAHRALTWVFEHSGPLLRLAFGAKVAPILWFEKWLTYITGERFTAGRLQEIGARIFNLERMYNLREGFTGADDTLPDRILNEPTFPGMAAGHPLPALLPRYYALRGWDRNGVPTARTLARLRVRV
jgi:aldehyde:ferredoxin oxidoreductase